METALARRFGGATLADARGLRFRSGLTSSFMNGVLWTTVTADEVAELRDDVRAWFPSGIRWTWQTSALDRPTDLAARLSAAGFLRVNVLPAMTLDLAPFSPAPAPPRYVEVAEVNDAADVEAWLTARNENHPLDAASRAAWIRTQPSQLDPGLRQFVARESSGQPVGSMTLFIDGDVAGLYHVDVIPSARGRGVGTSMTRTALAAARRSGARLAVLTSTELGMHLYRPLGFQPVHDGNVVVWSPPEDQLVA
jgi:ribosomal protein S18 acetylase RimI-like enzyme